MGRREGPRFENVFQFEFCVEESQPPSRTGRACATTTRTWHKNLVGIATSAAGQPHAGISAAETALVPAQSRRSAPACWESRSQKFGVQALSGAREPDPEAVLRPARRPQQNDPGSLHEERA